MNDRPAAVDALMELLRPVVAELVAEELERREQSNACGWLTVEEYAAVKRTTTAAVHKRLERGRIPGAVREGKRWLIPALATICADTDNSGRAPRKRPRPGTRRS